MCVCVCVCVKIGGTCMYILMFHLNNAEIKAVKRELLDLSSTKNELCGEIHHYKQSLKSVEETLFGRYSIFLNISNILSTCRNKYGKEFTFE